MYKVIFQTFVRKRLYLPEKKDNLIYKYFRDIYAVTPLTLFTTKSTKYDGSVLF